MKHISSFQISGIAYFSPRAAAVFLSFHNIPPLDSCTYVGIDNGAQPLSVSVRYIRIYLYNLPVMYTILVITVL